ncbi:MAG: DNA ligase D, partial [Burkholderiales bacterium]|nr:DNA ligase D [Burkholderiales bacterium]
MARSRADPLSPYRKKRDFTQTCEPDGVERRAVPSRPAGALRYFVQRHEARRLHYDFRLELHGVLKSWAVPKGPSLDAATKRLAVHVEDHPLEYGRFEGRIPPGLYGAGQVMLWDDGIWTPLDDPEAAYAKGHLRFRLDGRRLRGDWMLIRTGREPDHWLLRKLDDPDAQPGHDAEADHAAGCPEHLPAGTPSSARFPDTLQPQLATLVDRAPTEPGWIYEIKLDGYRMLCRCDGDDIRFFTRNGVDFSHHLESVRNVLRRRVETDRLLWLDGEIVVFDEAGVSSFAALRDALANGPQRIVYVVFDLLHRGNRDLRPLPQEERTAALRAFFERLPATAADPIRYSDSVVATGADLWPLACERGLEGLIGKRLDARYVTGRSTAWIKLKCRPRQEVIVGGYTESASSRHGLGALLVGVRNGHDGIDYAGRIGTGFDAASARMLLARLTPLRRDRSPFTTTPPADHRGRIRWVRPDVVVDTQFAGWTSDRMLRQASYVGLRDDKPSTDVEREVPMKIETAADADRRTRKPANAERPAGVTITHPDRVVWSKPTTTKRDLARYYERIGDAMMPHLVDRPLSLLRCPDGTDSGCFFQKHLSHALPTGVRRFSPDGEREDAALIVVTSVAG